jgi:arsenite-transporting ATPase
MRIVLFTGKGGVGKTTLAAATAAHLARSGRKTLAVSTDPAHSLGDALEANLGGEPVEVDGTGGLFAAHVDARALLDGAWGRLREHLATVLAGAGVDELVADELTVLPGVEELLALSAVRRATETGPWEVVVVDCGPTAETLRLLALPEATSGYLERLFPAHRRAVRGLLARDRADARRWDRTAGARRPGGRARRPAHPAHVAADGHPARAHPERVVAAERRAQPRDTGLRGARRPASVPARTTARRVAGERRTGAGACSRRGVSVRAPSSAHRGRAHRRAALLPLAAQLGGDDDPITERASTPPLAVRRTAGSGRSADSEFELALHLPGAATAPLDLARIGDELAVTAAGVRRLVALPAVLRRCTVTCARLDGDDLRVAFRPDPALWLR